MERDTFQFVVFLSALGLMFSLETLFAVRPWQIPRFRRLFFHLGLSLFNSVVLYFPTIVPLVLWQQFVAAKGWGLASYLGLSGPVEILSTLVVLDFFDYWWHRFNHEVPFLWRFHKVHHVDTHVDVTTASRFHPGEYGLSAIAKATWILLWGPSLWGFAIFEAGITIASQFHHANIAFPRRLETFIRKVIVTPRFHASHHTVNKRTSDANYSTIFIFWDKLGRTYQEPDDEEMKTLGLPKGREEILSVGPTLRAPFTSEY